MTANQQFEAVKFNKFEHGGETKCNRIFLGNLKPNSDGNGYRLYIPEGLSVSGEIVIQPKQSRPEEG